MYRGSKKSSGISPDGCLQSEERTSGHLEKLLPTQGPSCSLMQSLGRKSRCPAKSAFGKKLYSQVTGPVGPGTTV